jgi:hypothetical protein
MLHVFVASDRIKELMVDAIIAKNFSIPSTQGRINRNEKCVGFYYFFVS